MENDSTDFDSIEKETEPYKLELQSLREQNQQLIKTIQDYKLQLNSSKTNYFELTQNEFKLKSELNWCKAELNRSHSVINGLEKNINDSFSRLLNATQPLTDCKILLERFSLSESNHLNARKTNSYSLLTRNGSRSGSRTKHRVSPMVEGLPISKPTIKLQRVKIPSQKSTQNEKLQYNDTPTGAVLQEEPAVLVGSEARGGSETIYEPTLPIFNTPSIPQQEPNIPTPGTVFDEIETEIDERCTLINDLKKNLELTITLLTKQSDDLAQGKNAINKFYSTPPPDVLGFSSSDESMLQFTPENKEILIVENDPESTKKELTFIEEESDIKPENQNVSEVNVNINTLETEVVLEKRVNKKKSTVQNLEISEGEATDNTNQEPQALTSEDISDAGVKMPLKSRKRHSKKPVKEAQQVSREKQNGNELEVLPPKVKKSRGQKKQPKLEKIVQAEFQEEEHEAKQLRKRLSVSYKEANCKLKLRKN